MTEERNNPVEVFQIMLDSNCADNAFAWISHVQINIYTTIVAPEPLVWSISSPPLSSINIFHIFKFDDECTMRKEG